jgi:hypothetical protein
MQAQKKYVAQPPNVPNAQRSSALLSPQRKRVTTTNPDEGSLAESTFQKRQKKCSLNIERQALENEKRWATSSHHSSLALSVFEDMWKTSCEQQLHEDGTEEAINEQHILLDYLPFLQHQADANTTTTPDEFKERREALIALSQGGISQLCTDSSQSKAHQQRLHLMEALLLEATETSVQTTNVQVKAHPGGSWQVILTFHPGLAPLMLLSCQCTCSLGTVKIFEDTQQLENLMEERTTEAQLCFNNITNTTPMDNTTPLRVEGEWCWGVAGGSGGQYTTPFSYELKKQAPERMHWKTPQARRR